MEADKGLGGLGWGCRRPLVEGLWVVESGSGLVAWAVGLLGPEMTPLEAKAVRPLSTTLWKTCLGRGHGVRAHAHGVRTCLLP